MSTPRLAPQEARSLLAGDRYRRLWLAHICATIVTYGLVMAGAILVEETTHSSGQTGVVIISAILPAFLASLISGAVVDRWGRVQTLISSHLARALAALAFWTGALLLAPAPALVLIFLVNAALTSFTQLSTTAELALLPDLVSEQRIVAANALLQLGTVAAEGLGVIVLTPLLVKWVGASAVGLVSAGLFLLALVVIAGLPRDRPAPTHAQALRSRWASLQSEGQAGWRAIAADPLLRLVVVQATVGAALLLVLLSLVPGLVTRHFGLATEDAAFLMVPGGLGYVLGALLLSRAEHRLSLPAWITLGLVCLGAAIGAVGLVSAWAGETAAILVAPLIVVVGLGLAAVIIPARVILQERPQPAVRGRVIAVQLALANAAAILPVLLGGALADRVGIPAIIVSLGIVSMVTGVFGLKRAPAAQLDKRR